MMSKWMCDYGYNDFHKRLASLHIWNALLVTSLALSGLVMFSGYWREILGEARTGIKWLHVILGLISIVPVIYYMPHVTRHWKQLEGKVWQRFNVIKLLPAARPLPDSAPPIGGGARGKFRSYSVTRLPYFNNDNWSFTIDGLVEEPVTWNWEQFVALKRSVQVSDFHCVTG